jgi:hypothetical protein
VCSAGWHTGSGDHQGPESKGRAGLQRLLAGWHHIRGQGHAHACYCCRCRQAQVVTVRTGKQIATYTCIGFRHNSGAHIRERRECISAYVPYIQTAQRHSRFFRFEMVHLHRWRIFAACASCSVDFVELLASAHARRAVAANISRTCFKHGDRASQRPRVKHSTPKPTCQAQVCVRPCQACINRKRDYLR